MLPILIAAFGALFVLGSKKPKRKASSSPKGDQGSGGGDGGGGVGGGGKAGGATVLTVMSKPSVSGAPFAICTPPAGSPKGTYAAYDRDGSKCMVFWRPATRATVIQRIESELAKLSKAEQKALCSTDKCEEDPFALDPTIMCEWMPNPDRDAFLAHVIMLLWPNTFAQGSLPPPNTAAYFPKNVWSKVEAIFAYEFCGFNQVT